MNFAWTINCIVKWFCVKVFASYHPDFQFSCCIGIIWTLITLLNGEQSGLIHNFGIFALGRRHLSTYRITSPIRKG